MIKAMQDDALTLFVHEVRSAVETFLSQTFDSAPQTLLVEASRYVALGVGHRWRPLVAVAAGSIFCQDSLRITLPAACGVELAHVASLVLDDQPSMDDADIRHGKPCVHHRFPAWTVDLLPVYLLNLAYRLALENPWASAERRVLAALEMARAGEMMCQGQEADLSDCLADSEFSEEDLEKCYRQKSGQLFAAAAKSGALLCGATEGQARAVEECGMCLGLSYQFHDDVADVIADASELGKPTGMDLAKKTAVTFYGVEGARRKAENLVTAALATLERFGPRADLLRQLVAQAGGAASRGRCGKPRST